MNKPDPLAPLRALLSDSESARAISFPRGGNWNRLSGRGIGDFGNNPFGSDLPPGGIGGGGGQSGGGFWPGDGMDPWQASVEKRLDSLDRRLVAVEAQVTEIRVDVGTIKTNVAHLPGKGFVVTSSILVVTAIGAIVTFAEKVQSLLN